MYKKVVVTLAKNGRPTAYKPEYDEQAFKLCLLGATDKELADFFSVSEQTINAWKQKQPSFLESIKAGKEKADAVVAEKLYKKATGYKQTVNKVFQYQGDPVIVETTEEVAPDTTAQMFWLKNRQPKKWRDRHEVDAEIKGAFEVNINVIE
jgi:DNA-binding XRE family transcriptional regulator